MKRRIHTQRLYKTIGWFLLNLSVMVSCTSSLPKQYVDVQEDTLKIYPDYKNIIIPQNIAPLNFVVDNQADCWWVCVKSSEGNALLTMSDDDRKFCFSKKEWNKIMSENVSKTLWVDVYMKKKNTCYKYPSFKWTVVADSIDPYVTCRLIEPLYNAVGRITLSQFDLENGTYKDLADNKRFIDDVSREDGPKCVNCHTKQRNGSGNALFFCRGKVGGMVLTYNGKTQFVDTKVGDLRVSAVFSAWHPTKPYIAFSNNKVMQLFMSKADSKIEPLDFYSDLLMYDIERNEVSYILQTPHQMEMNPYWSADGKYVYYCSSDSLLNNQNVLLYKNMKYDLMRVAFQEDSLTWGKPEMVYHATAEGKSVSKPKISPDNRYVLFTLSDFGGYHYSHPDADLYIYDLEKKQALPLDSINTERAEGIGDWSNTGRWILVSSRVDGTYTRLFLSYFDNEGIAHKRFQLPHEDPLFDRDMMKNYNAPEFGTNDVKMTPIELNELVDKAEVLKANYRGEMIYQSDGVSGASVIK